MTDCVECGCDLDTDEFVYCNNCDYEINNREDYEDYGYEDDEGLTTDGNH